jgi:uncharacterized membrane protein YGL010W
MKNLSEQMAFYRSYHTTFGCQVTHWFGIPLVTFAILIPMGWVGIPFLGHRLTLATVFVISTLGYYFLLNRLLAWLMVVCIAPLAWAAAWAAARPFPETLWIFLGAFAGGWAFQLAGHAIEGKRPALLTNFTQAVFTAPLFLLAEVLSGWGWKATEEKRA